MEAENIVDKKELKGLPIWACILLFIVVFFVFMLLYSALIQGFLSLVLGQLAIDLMLRHLESGYQPQTYADGKVDFILYSAENVD